MKTNHNQTDKFLLSSSNYKKVYRENILKYRKSITIQFLTKPVRKSLDVVD